MSRGLPGAKGDLVDTRDAGGVQGEGPSFHGPLSSLQGRELQHPRAFPAALSATSPAVAGPAPGAGALAAGTPSEAAGPWHPPGRPRHHRVCRAHRQVSSGDLQERSFKLEVLNNRPSHDSRCSTLNGTDQVSATCTRSECNHVRLRSPLCFC